MTSGIIEKVVESLKSGVFLNIERSMLLLMEDHYTYLSELESNKKHRDRIEKIYYKQLKTFLERGQLGNFKKLLNYSDKLDIFIDIEKIPNRFEFLSKVHLNGITTGNIRDIFDVIRFFNDTGLIERDLSTKDLEFIEKIKKDKLLVANLKDIFNRVTNSLVYYTFKSMTDNMFKLILYGPYSSESSENDVSFFYNKENLLRYLDLYPMYGLRVENLGTIEDYIHSFQEYGNNTEDNVIDNDLNLIKYHFRKRTHIVSLKNIEKNRDKILTNRKHYNFYNLSMVLLGGLGPQGHGFTYSTPRGEVIEICSDRKENEAIIIRYKEFLKRQFLVKLRTEMTNEQVKVEEINRIMDFLSSSIKPDELINYFKKNLIIKQITQFLDELKDHSDFQETKLQDLIDKIEKAINIILRPIDLIDQFRCRMELIEDGKLDSEDIAKLTSLKGKSHYDVLRERFFFQNQIEWFYKLYSDEILEHRRQRERQKK